MCVVKQASEDALSNGASAMSGRQAHFIDQSSGDGFVRVNVVDSPREADNAHHR